MKLLQTTVRILVWGSLAVTIMLLADWIGRTYL